MCLFVREHISGTTRRLFTELFAHVAVARSTDGPSLTVLRYVDASCHFVHNGIHTHPFYGPLSRTTRTSRYEKGKTNLDFTEARDSEWQWHQLGRVQVCTSLQTDKHASTPPFSFYRPDALPAAKLTASSTEGSQELKYAMR